MERREGGADKSSKTWNKWRRKTDTKDKSWKAVGLMTTVVLCGEREDTGIRRVLVRALSRYGGVQWHDGRRLQASRPAPEFFLYETTHLPKAEQVEGILIFKNLFYLHEKEKAPVGFVPVLDAQNLAAASALRGTQAIGITCGASPRDTLSMASLRDDSAVVSLQRELRDLSGKIWEPHDRAIRLEAGAEMYPILAACAVLLLSGKEVQDVFVF